MSTMTRPVSETLFIPGAVAQAVPSIAPATRTVVGIHNGHNSAAALVEDGVLRMALQEERLTRVKNQGGLPVQALREIVGASEETSDRQRQLHIALGGKNLSACYWRREDILRSAGSPAPGLSGRVKNAARKNEMVSDWINRQKWSGIAQNVEKTVGIRPRSTEGVDHHECHAASAYFGWGKMEDRVLVLTCDGAGDRVCATVNIGSKGHLTRIAAVEESHSIGALYGKITYLSGMVPMEHEYKLMGLAPYAERAKESYAISEEFNQLFAFDRKNPMTWTRTNGCPSLAFGAEYLSSLLKRKRFDHIAGGVQLFVERFLVQWVKHCIAETGVHKVALSGGVFMNVKANQKILELPEVEELFIFPSCGDETNSIGAAWIRYSETFGQLPAPLADFYLGSEFSNDEIESAIASYQFAAAPTIRHAEDIERDVAELLAKGEVVARFKGRMEFGARALGNRSILANPAAPGVVKLINEMIKCRDFWMPFAPSVLAERSETYFKKPKPAPAPYMILTFDSREEKRDAMAAAIHPYDGTGRPQEVYEGWNPDYYRLISHFEAVTGEALILNTSFNLHGEPVVCFPQDALRVFSVSGLQHLAIGNFLLSKSR
jgi:carbamoyltransferase